MKNDEVDKDAGRMNEDLREKIRTKMTKGNFKYNEVEWAAIAGISREAYDTYIR